MLIVPSKIINWPVYITRIFTVFLRHLEFTHKIEYSVTSLLLEGWVVYTFFLYFYWENLSQLIQ
jgi:hypothetical protein